jgi:hypothetical protein
VPAIDEFSLTTIPIDLRFNEQPLSSATAFTWERDDLHYLITNWIVEVAVEHVGDGAFDAVTPDHMHRVRAMAGVGSYRKDNRSENWNETMSCPEIGPTKAASVDFSD